MLRGYRNWLAPLKHLRNEYVALRHGESEANVARIISCLPDTASGFKHGLSVRGHAQAQQAAAQLERLVGGFGGLGVSDSNGDSGSCGVKNFSEIVVYASDFRRTAETAKQLCKGLGLPRGPSWAPALRERSFGRLNLKADAANYARCWAADADSSMPWGLEAAEGVEPCQAVQSRATAFVATELEEIHDGALLVLVRIRKANSYLDLSRYLDKPRLITLWMRNQGCCPQQVNLVFSKAALLYLPTSSFLFSCCFLRSATETCCRSCRRALAASTRDLTEASGT